MNDRAFPLLPPDSTSAARDPAADEGHRATVDVRIRPYAEGDLPLLERLLGDSAMTVHLGGPESLEAIGARHRRYLDSDGLREGLFTVLAGPEDVAVGWVGYWAETPCGADVCECGWHVLPEFQRRGVATAAVSLVLERMRARDECRYVHAFPAVGNAASNALCRRLGFEFLGKVDVEYPRGSMMRSNDWRLDLHGSQRRDAGEVQPPVGHGGVEPAIAIEPLGSADCEWAEALVAGHFGSARVVTRGVLHDTRRLPGLIAMDGDEPVGLARYRIDGDECEVMLVIAVRRRVGIGTALLRAVRDAARHAGCERLWLVTTNDDLPAIAFYRALGWRLVAVHEGAVRASRVLKPEIPLLGEGGVPIVDELEFELLLGPAPEGELGASG